MASPDLITVTDENFQSEVLGSDVPVLVDFWATWCGPCRAIAPAVEQLAAQYKGKVKIAKMDIEEHPNASQKYGVTSIPMFLVFKGGKEVDKMMGNQGKAKLEEMIKRSL